MKLLDKILNRNKEDEQPVKPTVVIVRNQTPKPTKPKDPIDKVRSWDAASTGNLTFNWNAPETSTNALLKKSLTLLRARCRERVRNDDYAKAYLQMSVSNIVGTTGIRLQSNAKDPSGERDTLAIEAIESSWLDWAKYSKNVDITGKDNWKAILELLVRTKVTDGEIFIRHIEGGVTSKYGYSLQLIDPALCDEKYNGTLDNGNNVEMGVELNEFSKPVAYHFLKADSTGLSNKVEHIRVPAGEIIHAFVSEFAGQVRGIPPMAVSLSRMKMLSDFEDAALVNAQIGASKMGFYTTTGGEDLTTGTNTIEEDGTLIDEVQAGQFTKLPKNVGFEMFDSKYPDGEFAVFKKAMLRGVASGLGVDYATLGNDLESVNLSSSRVAINETREIWKSHQQFLIDKVVTEVFERWLGNALVRKQIQVKGRPLSIVNIEKFKSVNWLPRRWSFSDPSKDTKSNVDLVNNRIKSLSSVAAELGIDYETEIHLMVQDEELLAKNGLVRINQLPSVVEAEALEAGEEPDDK